MDELSLIGWVSSITPQVLFITPTGVSSIARLPPSPVARRGRGGGSLSRCPLALHGLGRPSGVAPKVPGLGVLLGLEEALGLFPCRVPGCCP